MIVPVVLQKLHMAAVLECRAHVIQTLYTESPGERIYPISLFVRRYKRCCLPNNGTNNINEVICTTRLQAHMTQARNSTIASLRMIWA